MFKPVVKLFKSLKFKYLSLFVVILAAIALFSLMYGNVKQETYELHEFKISPKTIRSLKTVEDTVKTEQEKRRIEAEVTPFYQFNEDISKNRSAIATQLFDIIIEAKQVNVPDPDDESKIVKSRSDQIKEIRTKFTKLEEEEPGLRLTNEAISSLLNENIIELRKMQREVSTIIEEELSKPIRGGDLSTVRYEVERKLRLSEAIRPAVLQTLITLGRSLVVETETINKELTNKRIEEEKNAVESKRILQGQVIVREGQFIDSEIYRQLELAGLLTNQSSLKPIIGLSLFVLFVSAIIYMHFLTWQEKSNKKKKSLLIVYSIFFILAVMMKLIGLIDKEFDVQVAFLFPTALAPLLVKLLTNERLAFMMTIVTAATAGIMLHEGFTSIMQMEIVLYILFGGIVSIYVLGNNGRRSNILRTSLAVAASNILFIGFYLLMTQSTYDLTELIFYLIVALTSGIVSGALTIGLMPFFESAFGLLSDMRLIELSNPNHPLLKKVLTETPGTYHHSVMVANLADAACESVGANGLLARVGSYYHDIGKTVRPNFFIENQHGTTNPHDALPPEKSRDIIIAHATDGADLLAKHKMPSEIVDIARQHHGTSFLKFFFVKAKEMGQDVVEDDFRYPGPKPQTKEIAIISISDSVEAAVRSIKEPTPEKISKLVKSIISSKLSDGQFDECDLSMRELKTIENVICETLNGIFHSRIEYPD
ncbi:HDIG domain-containing protein [Sporosarcina thermotolerans]|uniref:HDIG domain-containing protein n=1 Tax=Sporosarcina thermotolerans TaxID=633404 RepID=A0AAW9ABJ9_9BACL|nr:HDIG domain-containing metalloprotein [Sporosarcina thermotolerans]MDW0117385.1 HDIG domain-containing protein [Sporosarcina thermotolerans]WHT47522.1 HDIG domain-containing protein [Sporosarcina thermotolerans]